MAYYRISHFSSYLVVILCSFSYRASFNVVHGLQCYDCNSNLDPNCLDPHEDTTPVVECNVHSFVSEQFSLSDESSSQYDMINRTHRTVVPMCLTLEFQVIGKYIQSVHHHHNQRIYDHFLWKEMPRPTLVRRCANRTGTESEADRCITNNNPSLRYKQCTCTTDLCNDIPLSPPSVVWIYLLSTLVIGVAVAACVGYSVYKKTGCNFS